MDKINIDNLENLMTYLSEKESVDVITPSDKRYASARLVYNRMHDCYPVLIIRTLDVTILRLVMSFASKNDIVLAIRGGGHHIGGFGTCNNGIVIDFSPFKDIQVDLEKMIVSVEPGACLQDIDQTLSPMGYIVPTGTVSETGLGGLTLGGGIGWLIGHYGLTCDQLCGADVLLADGQLVRAEDPKHYDLLWALRGGGGNFGIILNFRYRLNPLPKTICGIGTVAWEHVPLVMSDLLLYLQKTCPPSITIAPIFTKDKQGNPQFTIDFCSADGTAEEMAALMSLSSHIQWSEVREWDFAAWQREFNQEFLPPMRGYWKAAYLETLTCDIVQKLCDCFEHSSIAKCTITIEHLHGAFKHYDLKTSAFPLRQYNFGVLFSARWENKEEDDTHIHWVRQSFNRIDPQGTSGAYLNYTSSDDQRAVHSLLSNTVSHITQVKSYYDPRNVFKRNHNVMPSKSQDA